MITYDEAQEALTRIADSIPQEIYSGLNGGIVLLPESKSHREARLDDLCILGEYHYDPAGLGRYITIYFGSFQRLHSRLSEEAFIDKLREVLYHELTHHLEHMAGDKSLERRDEEYMERYRLRRRDEDRQS